MGHLFITVSNNQTPNIGRMSGELVQNLVPKSVSVTELSSVTGTERATARRASCLPFIADARDKFFVNICGNLVGYESRSKHLIRGLRCLSPMCHSAKNLSQNWLKIIAKKCNCWRYGRYGAQKGQTYFRLYFQHAYLLEVSEGTIQFNDRLCGICGYSNNGVGFSPEYSALVGPYHSTSAPHLSLSTNWFKERAAEVNESQTINKTETGIILTLRPLTDRPKSHRPHKHNNSWWTNAVQVMLHNTLR